MDIVYFHSRNESSANSHEFSLCQVRGGTEAEWARVEWNYSGIEGFDNKIKNNLGLSLCAVPQSTVACVVAYFRRTELLSGISERSGID